MHHLYVHVPFCARRCSYCDFSIAVRKRIPTLEYVEAIRRELTGLPLVGPLESIYFGGGTPSLLPASAITTVLQHIAAATSVRDDAEITLEANPEDVTADTVAEWTRAGVNRVSLGVQSFDDRVLRWMHRVHDAERARSAVRTLRAGGIGNMSLDLIFAVPTLLERDWRGDLEAAIALEPDHLSLYGLTVEPRTPLERWIARGAAFEVTDERYADEYLLAHDRIGVAGFAFYEVSNAARGGRRSRHNSAYWLGRAYAGLGPAAHSYDGRMRRWNVGSWEAYRRAIAEGRSPVQSEEVLSEGQREMERWYLGLRTVEGVAVGDRARLPASLSALAAKGWIAERNGRVACTVEGWLRLDALIGALTGPSATS